MLKPISPVNAVLDVIAVISNPVRYLKRYELARNFIDHMNKTPYVRLTLVELAFGEREFELTEPDNPRHIQTRSSVEYWHKESLINLGISRLPNDWKYVAWIDADLTFIRPDWSQETIQMLQHYSIGQLFAEAHDLDSHGFLANSFRSFAYSYVHNIPRKNGTGYNGGTPPEMRPKGAIDYWHHPGFAWAARRDAIEIMGGLFDVAVVGEADYIMARGLVGEAEKTIYPGISPGYRKAVLDYQKQLLKLRSNIGYVPGTIIHHWHGKKADRHYWDRCKILRDTQFDPSADLKFTANGLYQLVDHGDQRSILLRDAIRAYFRSRNEDSTES